MYQTKGSWKAVAKYLHGEKWRDALDLAPAPAANDGNDSDSSSDTIDCIGGDNDISPFSVFEFINNFVLEDEDDHAVVAAFHFVKPIVHDDLTKEKREAEESAKLLDNTVLRAVIKLLSSRVEVSKRKRLPVSIKSAEKELVRWIQYPNAKREYMFCTPDALKNLIRTRRIQTRGPSRSIEKMIDALSAPPGEVEVDLEPKEAAMEAILQRSFLPHQKGPAREACSIGHILEKPILERWVVETSKRGYPVRGLSINEAYTAGLVAKQGSPWAKDSIDFIVSTKSNGNLLNELWGLEVKARVVPNTVAHEQEFIADTRDNKHIRIRASEAHKYVDAVSEIFQVLHHAYVYNFNTVVLVVGDHQSEIIQSTIIDFDQDFLDQYEEVLSDLKDLALSWFYEENISLPATVPQEILRIGEKMKNIPDDATIEGSVNLYLSLMSKNLPMPSFVRLIPAIYAYWNSVKSGSDTTTKLMDDRIIYPPHVNAESIACTRLILLMCVVIHRLHQGMTASNDLENEYNSLKHYRNAASHRTTFQKTLLTIYTVLKQKVLEKNDNDGNAATFVDPPAVRTRTMPLRRRFNGVIPQPMEFGVQLPFATPKKIKKKVQQNEVSEAVSKMYENCTGRLVQVANHSKRQRCSECGKKTGYYCAGCKSWFCAASRNNNNNQDDNPKEFLYYDVKGERQVFFASCYTKKHQSSWKKEDAVISASIASITP
jgi:hypothetical protein